MTACGALRLVMLTLNIRGVNKDKICRIQGSRHTWCYVCEYIHNLVIQVLQYVNGCDDCLNKIYDDEIDLTRESRIHCIHIQEKEHKIFWIEFLLHSH